MVGDRECKVELREKRGRMATKACRERKQDDAVMYKRRKPWRKSGLVYVVFNNR